MLVLFCVVVSWCSSDHGENGQQAAALVTGVLCNSNLQFGGDLSDFFCFIRKRFINTCFL